MHLFVPCTFIWENVELILTSSWSNWMETWWGASWRLVDMIENPRWLPQPSSWKSILDISSQTVSRFERKLALEQWLLDQNELKSCRSEIEDDQGEVLWSASVRRSSCVVTYFFKWRLLNHWANFRIISNKCSYGPLPKLLKWFRYTEQDGHQS